jgi:hypothetical protein
VGEPRRHRSTLRREILPLFTIELVVVDHRIVQESTPETMTSRSTTALSAIPDVFFDKTLTPWEPVWGRTRGAII